MTGGIVTVHDSNWLMSWTINRQPQYVDQPKDDVCVWVYGLFSDKKGNYIDKPMRDCTGKEITKEWLYHIGVPTSEIDRLAKDCSAIPVMMPYITSHFEPREFGDRPYVVPKGAVNFAFLGQFAETLDKQAEIQYLQQNTQVELLCKLSMHYVELKKEFQKFTHQDTI